MLALNSADYINKSIISVPSDDTTKICDTPPFDIDANSVPFCMAILAWYPNASLGNLQKENQVNQKIKCVDPRITDIGGKYTYAVTQINQAFEDSISPLYKLKESNFFELISNNQHKNKLFHAIDTVITGKNTTKRARNIEMTTLVESNSGLPIKRHYDWTVVKRAQDQQLLLFGDPVSDDDAEQRAKDAELVDFFQNAPIALHWLSGEGIVLWANQTELDVLGYTAEEYIGQPIMKFCPDEEELVLEIFKQLGSGNAIRDVPVRFRTKDGRIVNLLIDSNVKYDDAGNFAHTRCFIRDDTPRKIREAQAKLLLDETKRSLKMLDNFMSRSMHHMRTPLHVLQRSMDIVSNYLVNIAKAVRHGDSVMATSLIGESQEVLDQAGDHVIQAVEMIEDISDLARLDQGQELELSHESIDLKELGKEVFGSTEVPANVEAALEFSGGPSYIFSDRGNLKKILRYLLEHVLSGAQGDEKRTVSLVIGQIGGNISFTILDSMHLIDSMHSMSCNDNYSMGDTPPDARGSSQHNSSGVNSELPLIFQRYHQELLPDTSLDFEEAGDLRSTIEAGINSHRVNSIGIGLPLSHHLVRVLGGDLRYSTQGADMTKFWFTLPSKDRQLEPERIVIETAKRGKRRRRSSFIEVMAVTEDPAQQKVVLSKKEVASCGLKALESTSVLVVEDVPMCAKLMCNILRQLGCSPTWVENGQEAIDKLRSTDDSTFDLVFMDLRMPVMDGLTATKILRDDLKMQIPVVALTGDAGLDVKEQCGKIGFSEYCNKPLKRKDLVRILETYKRRGRNE